MGKKSKTPKGRAGAKQKAQKGTPNKRSSGGGGPSRNSFLARQMLDEDEDAFQSFQGFSQSRDNRRNFTPRDPAVKLRHQAISFVSASNTPIGSDIEQPQAVEETIFVAAEDSDDEDDVDDDHEEEFLDDSAIQTNLVTETDIAVSQNGVARMHLDSTTDTHPYSNATHLEVTQKEEITQSNASLFFIDTMGDASLTSTPKSKGKQPVRRAPSPAKSDSSEEVVVFHGRNKARIINDPPTSQAIQTFTPPNSQQRPNQKPFNQQPNGRANQPNGQYARPMGWAAKPAKHDAEINANAKWAPAPAGSWWKKPKPRPDLNPSPAQIKASQDAPMKESKVSFAEQPVAGEADAEESIASLQADWKAVIRDKRAAKQSSVRYVPAADLISLNSPTSNRRGKRGRKKDNRHLRQPIEEDDEIDDSAFEDYLANMAAQEDGNDGHMNGDGGLRSMMSNFAGLGGPSLVVDGQDVADDEVLNKEFIFNGTDDSSSDDSIPIGQDLDELSDDDVANDSDMDSSELEGELEYTEREQWEDEEDLRQRRREAMTDEQLARIFAKQQELGIDGDEIILENGDYGNMMDNLEGVGDVAQARAGLADMTNLKPGKTSNKNGMPRRSNQRDPSFPDASALADTLDQYGENGFDIMDFDRPSLKPKKKGRKGKLPPELEALSDDELRESMATSWEGDRATKRLKKAEREELRQQGMLGSTGKKGKADLSQKYQFGILRHQINQELRDFMQDEGQTSLPFPPMNKIDRKDLHDMANALNLKSKSVGTGWNRFPVIYKTQNSVYDSQRFDRAIALAGKGMLDRNTTLGRKFNKQSKKTGKFSKTGMSGGGTDAAARVRHGEVVGAGAAEISQDSFGHRMMEKMGWSKGMALGREGEGRLNPVEQVMREGRAGLG